MYPRRPTSPLSFEPLLPSSSDVVYGPPDSDDELDEASRAVKRRKIEQLARDYLNGRPAFILSASLKGPLDNGWVNPWREEKRKTRKQKHYEGLPASNNLRPKKNLLKASGIPESASEYSRDDTTSRASTRPSRSITPKPKLKSSLASYSKLFHSSELANPNPTGGNTQRRTSEDREDLESGRRSVSQVSSRTGSRGIHSSIKQVRDIPQQSSDNTWLRKDKKRAYDHGMGSRVPSPSPSTRPARPQDSNKSPKLSHLQSPFYVHGSEMSPRVHGFTAVNTPKSKHKNNRLPVEQPNLPVITNSIKRSSQLCRSLTYKKNDSRTDSKTLSDASSLTMSHQEEAQQRDQPLEEPDVLRHSPVKSRKPASNLSEMTLPDPPSLNVSKPFTSQVGSSGQKDINEHPQDPTEVEKTQETGKCRDSALPPASSKEAEADCSAVTESDHITSAQIVPDYYRSKTHITPLNSLEFITTNGHNTYQDEDGRVSDFHTLRSQDKATAPGTQESAVRNEELPPPEVSRTDVRSNKRPRRIQSMPLSRYNQIKPFRSFHDEAAGASETKVADEEGKPCHERTVTTATHDMDESKKLRFNHEHPSSLSASKIQAPNPDEIRLDRKRPSPATHALRTPYSADFKKAKRVASLPSLSLNTSAKTSQSTGVLKFSPQEIMSILQRGGPSDLHSSPGTPLAFTFSESTQSTKQDGQGAFIKLRDFEDFDLSKAIEDAGSFLQSWDLEKDVQRLKNGDRLSAPSERLKEPKSSVLKGVR